MNLLYFYSIHIIISISPILYKLHFNCNDTSICWVELYHYLLNILINPTYDRFIIIYICWFFLLLILKLELVSYIFLFLDMHHFFKHIKLILPQVYLLNLICSYFYQFANYFDYYYKNIYKISKYLLCIFAIFISVFDFIN